MVTTQTESRFDGESGGVVERVRDAGLDRLVVRNRRIVIGGLKRLAETREARRQALDVRFAIEAQCERQL